ncbi:hypothetical protein ACFL20_01715 [Spirochaetota bacterium]
MDQTHSSGRLKFGFLEIMSTCNKCGSPVFINGPLSVVLCNSCQSEMAIPHDTIKDSVMNIFEGWVENDWGDLQGSKSTVMSSINYEVTMARQDPCCRKCNTYFTGPNLEDRPGIELWEIVCSECGAEMPVTRPPNWLVNKYPKLKIIVNAESAEPDGEPEKPAFEGVVFSCPKCGGTLEIDGMDRIVHCKYCDSNVYLPDDLWLRLHPAKKVQRWYIGFTGFPDKLEAKKERVKKKLAAKQRREQLKKAKEMCRQELMEIDVKLEIVQNQLKIIKRPFWSREPKFKDGKYRKEQLSKLNREKSGLIRCKSVLKRNIGELKNALRK